jgi:GLPGLI family protein
MKKNILLLLLFVTSNVHAQDSIDQLRLRVRYVSTFKEYETKDGYSREDEKLLDIGSRTSKFYSLWKFRNGEISDSVRTRGGNIYDVFNARREVGYPNNGSDYVVYKNYPSENTLTYTDDVFRHFIYTEPLESPHWDIVPDSYRTIAGYRCQEAKTLLVYKPRTAVLMELE